VQRDTSSRSPSEWPRHMEGKVYHQSLAVDLCRRRRQSLLEPVSAPPGAATLRARTNATLMWTAKSSEIHTCSPRFRLTVSAAAIGVVVLVSQLPDTDSKVAHQQTLLRTSLSLVVDMKGHQNLSGFSEGQGPSQTQCSHPPDFASMFAHEPEKGNWNYLVSCGVFKGL
jgi:hypothetical protein